MWQIKLLYLIVFTTTVKSEDSNTDTLSKFRCKISGEFSSALLIGLINEYKYNDILAVYQYMDEIYKSLDKLDDDLRRALRSNYNSEVKFFGFSTVNIRQLMDKTLNMVYLMNAKPSDFNVQKIADLITQDNFNSATQLIERLDTEILIYPIVELVFREERQALSIEKLINFTYYYLSNTRSISKVVAMELTMFKEMSQDPDNLFSYDMMVFAELLRETILKLTTFYKHATNQQVLLEKLKFLRVSLPRQIQNIVFFKKPLLCFENYRWNEFLFIDDDFLNGERDKRIVYTWERGLYSRQKLFLIEFDRFKFGYTIKNTNMSEYLYSPSNNVVFDVDNRYTLSKSQLDDYSYWSFTPINNNLMAIRNIRNNEYIYSPEDTQNVAAHDKRRVFARRIQGDLNVEEIGSQVWWISPACSKA